MLIFISKETVKNGHHIYEQNAHLIRVYLLQLPTAYPFYLELLGEISNKRQRRR